MLIEMVCPVCGEKVEIKLPELETTFPHGKEEYAEIEMDFECPECEKSYKISG